MQARGVRVKIVDSSDSYVSYRYVSSNARARVRREDFDRDYKSGKIDVTNPDKLK